MCDNCFFDIVEETFAQCVACLRPVANDNICQNCKLILNVDNGWVVASRSGAVKKLVDLYKFERTQEACGVLARLLDARLPQISNLLVTSVPTIPSHRRQRGYDHMELLARKLANARGLDYKSLLIRKTTLPQRGFNRSERLKRQKGAFKAEQVLGAPVLLIDDVFTTGATIRSAVGALRDAGCTQVYIALVCRQMLDDLSDL